MLTSSGKGVKMRWASHDASCRTAVSFLVCLLLTARHCHHVMSNEDAIAEKINSPAAGAALAWTDASYVSMLG